MARTKKTARRSTGGQQQNADHTPSMALASEDAMKDNEARKTALDARTLQIRFFKDFPKTSDDIKELHSDIKFVRTQRRAGKKKDGISCALVEFEGPEECKAAKNKLATTQCGLAEGIDERNLKEMFPKAAYVDIPSKSKKKGSSYGFVKFSNPSDAQEAFDAAQDLTINDFKITVLFAKQKKEERKANGIFKKEVKVNKKAKKENKESTGEKRKSAEDTNETGVKKAKVEKGESKLDIEKGMRKEEFYFLYKKAIKSENEDKVAAEKEDEKMFEEETGSIS